MFTVCTVTWCDVMSRGVKLNTTHQAGKISDLAGVDEKSLRHQEPVRNSGFLRVLGGDVLPW